MTDQARQGLLSPFLQRKRIEAALPFLTGKLLDFGCGNGALFSALSPGQRRSYVGYDLDADVVREARRRWSEGRFVGELSELDGERFDTVVSLAVIEHAPSIPEFLRTLRHLAGRAGIIVLTSPHPAFDALYHAGAGVGLFSSAASEEHEELVTRASMEKYCAEADLELRAFRRFLLGANQLFVLRQRQ